MSAITDHLQTVRTRVCRAAQQAHRDPSSVNLLAVSKTQPVSAILEAAEAGQLAFGENYEQEAVRKIMEIRQNRPDLKLEWHFIGPIQSNKTRAIAEHFDWVHSVDRERIARRLSDQRPEDMPPLNICLQVNISGEDSKSGVRPEELADLVKAVSGMPRLKLRGLMAIPEPQSDPEKQRQPFSAMKTLFEELKHTGYDLDTLSMGMSDDMEAAIQEGATTVRIGTAIFGQRHYPGKR
ncbi:YggS family pyridoxal phosphate-dependent enzyme [Oxalobacter sp. OxGP1]|uniref:YggS family pyridoxal phosphate-dependent enzyme n=1 Tax=Oxalobacter paeniformigenes TaxID=2946594 RepID=UPI0022AFDC3A|nr:YggS family pyridoxal phosphate-dependent enzyme [Oxalobacter paeniformigenes]MCZ4053543.1 YggS family pyridoxal phosphate-dependent enzyme [Oxalobacter paeniformigenes]